MKITAYAVCLSILTLPALASASDRPSADWIQKPALKQQMQAAGYSAITVGADDGHWEGEAVKDGHIVEFQADSHTGKITKSQPKPED